VFVININGGGLPKDQSDIKKLRSEAFKFYQKNSVFRLPFYLELKFRCHLDRELTLKKDQKMLLQFLIQSENTELIENRVRWVTKPFQYWSWHEVIQLGIKLKATLLLKNWIKKLLPEMDSFIVSHPENSSWQKQLFKQLEIAELFLKSNDRELIEYSAQWIQSNFKKALDENQKGYFEVKLKYIQLCLSSKNPQLIQIGANWIKSNQLLIDAWIATELMPRRGFLEEAKLMRLCLQSQDSELVNIAKNWIISRPEQVCDVLNQEYLKDNQIKLAELCILSKDTDFVQISHAWMARRQKEIEDGHLYWITLIKLLMRYSGQQKSLENLIKKLICSSPHLDIIKACVQFGKYQWIQDQVNQYVQTYKNNPANDKKLNQIIKLYIDSQLNQHEYPSHIQSYLKSLQTKVKNCRSQSHVPKLNSQKLNQEFQVMNDYLRLKRSPLTFEEDRIVNWVKCNRNQIHTLLLKNHLSDEEFKTRLKWARLCIKFHHVLSHENQKKIKNNGFSLFEIGKIFLNSKEVLNYLNRLDLEKSLNDRFVNKEIAFLYTHIL